MWTLTSRCRADNNIACDEQGSGDDNSRCHDYRSNNNIYRSCGDNHHDHCEDDDHRENDDDSNGSSEYNKHTWTDTAAYSHPNDTSTNTRAHTMPN